MEEEIENEEIEYEEEIDRSHLTLQQFMNDMSELGKQVTNKDIVKPNFHYGSLEITNYLLWLITGELMILNDSIKEE